MHPRPRALPARRPATGRPDAAARHRTPRGPALAALPALLLVLSACSGEAPRQAALPAPVLPTTAPSLPVTVPSTAAPEVTAVPAPPAASAPAPAAAPAPAQVPPAGAPTRPVTTGLPLPPPATRAPAAPAAPAVALPVPAGCASQGEPVAGTFGTVPTDRTAALAATCADGPAVLVYALGDAAPRLLGDALPADGGVQLQAVQVRDGHLVVAAYDRSPGRPAAEPADLLVTSRWLVRGGRLVRTERWSDPAGVADVDEHG